MTADRYVESLKARVAAVVYTAMTDHIHCAVFRAYPKNPPSREQMVSDMGPQFKDLIPIVRDKVPAAYRLEQAHRCTSGGREYVHLIFRDRLALISVIATIRRAGESVNELPAADANGRVRATSVDQYQVAAFDAGKFMAYVVSDLPRKDNVADGGCVSESGVVVPGGSESGAGVLELVCAVVSCRLPSNGCQLTVAVRDGCAGRPAVIRIPAGGNAYALQRSRLL